MGQEVLFELPDAPMTVAASAPAAATRRRPAANGGHRLDDAQAAAVAHRGGGLLVLGGPGTGKTTTVVEVAAARATPGAAHRVLVLAAGRAAAAELRERIGARLGAGALPTVATFHAFALAAVRAAPAGRAGAPAAEAGDPVQRELRLLTAGEQEVRLRELLVESVRAGRVEWPGELSGALGTQGIAAQVRALIARARGLGLDGAGLAALGRRHAIPAWQALGPFLEEYLDTLGFEGVIDYQELTHQVMVLAHHRHSGQSLRERFDLVLVDEFQDIEPAQVATLVGLARTGTDVVAVGDPDQAMYGFRGGELSGISEFQQRFAVAGVPAPVVVLRRSRRCAAAIRQAAGRVLAPTALAPLPARVLRALRNPVGEEPYPGTVVAEVYPSAAAEAAGIADRLVRAHAGGLAWEQMAVLVRNPHGPVQRLQHCLSAAGVPVQVQIGDLPLGEQPAVAALLDLLSAAVDTPARSHPEPTDLGLLPAWRAAGLLAGPVGRADRSAAGLLGAQLVRAANISRASQEARPPWSGPGDLTQPQTADQAGTALAWAIAQPQAARDLLLRSSAQPPEATADASQPGGAALTGPAKLGADEGCLAALHWLVGAARVGEAVRAGRAALGAGAHPADVLWAIWSATDWPDRLRARALRGGPNGLRADADLDAVSALFDLAARMPAQAGGPVGAMSLLRAIQAQEVPIDLRWAHGPRRPSVMLASVHAAKGRAWSLVVVAGVQEGQWPDLRPRTELLGTDRLGGSGLVDPASSSDILTGERRLFYAACARANHELVVTSVHDQASRPSRFCSELGVELVQRSGGTLGQVSEAGIVARLRLMAADPDPELAQAAAQRLARLAALTDSSGRPLAPLASQANWWFARPLSTSPQSEAGVGSGSGLSSSPPVVLSGSTVAGLAQCPLRWFLDRRCAGAPVGPAVGVGLLVHEAAAALAGIPGSGDAANREELLTALTAIVAAGWDHLVFPAPYQARAERLRVERMLATLVDWHQGSGRTPVAVEHRFNVTLRLSNRQVRLVGAMDRIDRDRAGQLHLVDFKTGRTPISRVAALTDPQLGVYQLAARHGALHGTAAGPVASRGDGRPGAQTSGAELVYLSRPQSATGMPTVRVQEGLGERSWAAELVADVAELLASGQYPARPSPTCATCRFVELCPAMGRCDDDEPET